MREEAKTSGEPPELIVLESLLGKPRAEEKTSAEDTTCGIGCLRGKWLQSLAKENIYVFIYGILGCFYGSYFAYFNGTITTLEKRFKIPSKRMGIIATGSDIMHIFVSPILSYYTSKGHRPRWVAFGIYTVVLSCTVSALPHLIYGPGDNLLEFTKEFGKGEDGQIYHGNGSICTANSTTVCGGDGEGMIPTIILFLAQIIQGFGGCLYYTVGTAYMDDNIKKSKTPALISFSYVLRMFGPAFGYWLSSVCLKVFVVPSLTPTIQDSDPRWIGAWWLGNIVIGLLLFILATLIMLFPKTLPRAAVRTNQNVQQKRPNLKDMAVTFKRLISNRTYNCNNLEGAFNILCHMAYWIFLPKYIETEYRKSASVANFVTGTVSLIFSTIGTLVAGTAITRFKPRARLLAGWNVVVGVITTFCLLSYTLLGCPENDEQSSLMASRYLTDFSQTCSRSCHCDYVMLSPVCSENGQTFLSPCHAGCKNNIEVNGTQVYTECACIGEDDKNGKAFNGACRTECETNFRIFLALLCLVTFLRSTSRPFNFLVQLRCVEERDKSVALGLGMMFLSLFAFLPSPILFGYILDKTCLIWGKTCEATGNCWLYNSEKLRYFMNLTSASLVAIATFFDIIIWYLVKNLKIFDEKKINNHLET